MSTEINILYRDPRNHYWQRLQDDWVEDNFTPNS